MVLLAYVDGSVRSNTFYAVILKSSVQNSVKWKTRSLETFYIYENTRDLWLWVTGNMWPRKATNRVVHLQFCILMSSVLGWCRCFFLFFAPCTFLFYILYMNSCTQTSKVVHFTSVASIYRLLDFILHADQRASFIKSRASVKHSSFAFTVDFWFFCFYIWLRNPYNYSMLLIFFNQFMKLFFLK